MIVYVVIYAHPRDGNGRVLLVLKDRPPHLAGRLNLPGGKVEPGESPDQAAVREFVEETGIKPTNMSCRGRIVGRSCLIYCYRTDVDADAAIAPRNGETEEFAWHEWADVTGDARLMPNLLVTVPLMRRAGVAEWTLEDSVDHPKNNDGHYVTLTVPPDGDWLVRFKTAGEKVAYFEKKAGIDVGREEN